jgi:hypothetical protein
MITGNTFSNNFAKLMSLNILIYKLGTSLTGTKYSGLNCTGIFIDSNSFTNNYGCANTQGNVMVISEPNSRMTATQNDYDQFYLSYTVNIDQSGGVGGLQSPLIKFLNAQYGDKGNFKFILKK